MRTYAPRTPEQEQLITAEALRRIDYVWSNNNRLLAAVGCFRSAREAFRAGRKADALDLSYSAMFQAEQVTGPGYHASFREPGQNAELSEQHNEAFRIRNNIKEWANWAFVGEGSANA